MFHFKRNLLSLAAFFFISPMLIGAYSQNKALYTNKVETLKISERLLWKTNTFDWLLLTPNLGLEVTLGDKNWSKWTLGLSGRINWASKPQTITYNVFDLYDGRVELRKYWHAKTPRRVFYMGVYGGYGNYDLKFAEVGKRANALIGGATIGTVTELYGYQNGAKLDLDLGLNLGVVFANVEEYKRQLVNGQYAYKTINEANGYKLTFDPLLYGVATDVVRVSLVYHFGTSVANRYKKRAAIDDSYRIKLANDAYRRDTLKVAKAEQKKAKHIEKARNKRLKERALEQQKAEKANKNSMIKEEEK